MRGHWSHICPRCGKFFARSTPAQVAVQLGVSTVVAVVLVVGLVILLWKLG